MESELLYAVWPGSVDLVDQDGIPTGETRTFTALELATAYGVEDTDYLVVNSELDLPRDPMQRMLYIELKPRPDNYYENIRYTAEDDNEDVAYRPDFDASKKWIDETDPQHIYPDEEEEEKLYDD